MEAQLWTVKQATCLTVGRTGKRQFIHILAYPFQRQADQGRGLQCCQNSWGMVLCTTWCFCKTVTPKTPTLDYQVIFPKINTDINIKCDYLMKTNHLSSSIQSSSSRRQTVAHHHRRAYWLIWPPWLARLYFEPIKIKEQDHPFYKTQYIFK